MEQDTSQSMQTLLKLDLIKSRMNDASAALQVRRCNFTRFFIQHRKDQAFRYCIDMIIFTVFMATRLTNKMFVVGVERKETVITLGHISISTMLNSIEVKLKSLLRFSSSRVYFQLYNNIMHVNIIINNNVVHFGSRLAIWPFSC